MTNLIRSAVATTLLLASSHASAAIVEAFGDNVKFTYDDSTLFGTIHVVGDSFFFLPDDFKAHSIDGVGVHTGSNTDIHSDIVDVTVEVLTAGFSLTGFGLHEEGDYQSVPVGTNNAAGEFRVTSLTSSNTASDIFDTGLLLSPIALTPWAADAAVDLSSIAGWGSDTEVIIRIQNTLQSTTLLPTQNAYVAKKYAGVDISVIPIPAAVWLFGSGLMGLCFWRRK